MSPKVAVSPAFTRTVALVGHRGAGKTSLAEMMLHAAGVVRTAGRVEAGTSLLDHDPEERRRRHSVQPGFAWLQWDDYRIQLVDLPWSDDPVHAWDPVLSAVDGAVVVLSASEGMQMGAETALSVVRDRDLPTVVVLNKVDRAEDLDALLADLETRAGVKTLPLQLPFDDDEGRFSGVVSLVQQRVLRYDHTGSGQYSKEPLPRHLEGAARAAWERVVEAVALTDDALLEEYLEYLELPLERVRAQLARAVRERKLLPVLFASSTECIGGAAVLDLLLWALPSVLERPAVANDRDGTEVVLGPDSPFVAQLLSAEVDAEGTWRWICRIRGGVPPRGPWLHQGTGPATRPSKLYDVRGPRRSLAREPFLGQIVACYEPVHGRPGDTLTDGAELALPRIALPPPMMCWQVEPPLSVDEEAWARTLERLLATDPVLGLLEEEGHTLLTASSAGPLHRAVSLLRERMGVAVQASLPAVPYRERVTSIVPQVQGIFRRTSAGLNEYGEAWIQLAPAIDGAGVEFEDAVPEELLPRRYVPMIEQGVREAMAKGPKGFPVVSARVICTGGEYDALDSTEEHLRLAGLKAGRNALERAQTELLEPWSRVELDVPSSQVGEVISDLSSRRGRVVDLQVDGAVTQIRAECPYRELRGWAPRLLSLTHGRGHFRWSLSHYGPVPSSMTGEILRETAQTASLDGTAR